MRLSIRVHARVQMSLNVNMRICVNKRLFSKICAFMHAHTLFACLSVFLSPTQLPTLPFSLRPSITHQHNHLHNAYPCLRNGPWQSCSTNTKNQIFRYQCRCQLLLFLGMKALLEVQISNHVHQIVIANVNVITEILRKHKAWGSDYDEGSDSNKHTSRIPDLGRSPT